MMHLRSLFAVAVVAMSVAAPSWAQTPQWQRFAPAIALLQDKAVQADGLTLDLPSLSENGSAVALGVLFEGKLDDGDTLDAIHILSTANPNPEVIAFHLLDGRIVPEFHTRIRLSESQTVVAVATSRQGKAWVVEQPVRVTVSGCVGSLGSDDSASVQMQNPRVALPARHLAGRPLELRTVVQHPMETGLRTGPDGQVVAQQLIHTMEVSLDGQPVVQTRFFSGTAANPYVRLSVNPGSAEAVQLVWTDQSGRQLSEERVFPA